MEEEIIRHGAYKLEWEIDGPDGNGSDGRIYLYRRNKTGSSDLVAVKHAHGDSLPEIENRIQRYKNEFQLDEVPAIETTIYGIKELLSDATVKFDTETTFNSSTSITLDQYEITIQGSEMSVKISFDRDYLLGSEYDSIFNRVKIFDTHLSEGHEKDVSGVEDTQIPILVGENINNLISKKEENKEEENETDEAVNMSERSIF